MAEKVRIRYKHQIKDDVELEVVVWISEVTEDTTFVTRIDGYPIDILTVNIVSQEVLL